ncbi:DUF4212 domain-containing protein (plasmid) [Haloferax mediterranei ATCC 33500]|uniref:DUF4212 domain-containing protein n=1 Tax=Haloferax mediterranei (strain ATCC 33500 / DSM 1411 / JCM 8866 / NBRC 14739 / NCIMB 2177 / R-4) TaxID=523841 RepID=I3R9Q6_HALMT|nr:DUF4212 domain-containing protein [Haloferax mediterranei]AFK20966.1 hypothetical protein HFX_5132 [Haloferax mediterranei ATCC 33500]AHZ24170.1 sodium:solute symporter [Haloferax mediterranei ATCC 33500]EMA05247.1 hypothetical protein C439_00570 [Haloferax mediterranei ATCC 33500]MDX5989949.1 DUF4212 domain-containing protein [Haloferax mediterranei ATCC 33500]QCQ77137.1 DUF4212 domain-containing protein [Haloferax mediterranei ATCC 33500]
MSNEITESEIDSHEAQAGRDTAARHEQVDYLNSEVNLLKPSTPFMRDHLKVVWVSFIAWALLTFGPPVLTYLAPATMTTQLPVIGFPAHYFLVAVLTPTSSLVLAFIYSRKRDQLDEKYGIDHSAATEDSKGEKSGEAAVADGGSVE